MGAYQNIRGSSGKGYQNNAGMLEDAAKALGIDVKYMQSIGGPESGWNPSAKNPYGSAAGLFQFIDSSWNVYKKKYGKQLGIPANATQYDAKASALLGAAAIKDHIDNVRKNGREVTATDVYMNHFLGHGGYNKFAQALKKNPNASVASIMDNKTIGINKVYTMTNGRVNTLQEMYNAMAKKMGQHGTPMSNSQSTQATMVQSLQPTITQGYQPLDASIYNTLPDFSQLSQGSPVSMGQGVDTNNDLFSLFGSEPKEKSHLMEVRI